MNADAITGGCNCWSCVNFVPHAVASLEFIDAEIRRMQRSVRKAAPTPATGVSGGLTLLRQSVILPTPAGRSAR